MEAKLLGVRTAIRPRITVHGSSDAILALQEVMVSFTIQGKADYTLTDVEDSLAARGYFMHLNTDNDIVLTKLED